MTLQDWTFQELINETSTEFGVGTNNPRERGVIGDFINRAVNYCTTNTKPAPWNRKDLILSIDAPVTATGTVTTGSTQVTALTVTPSARSVMVVAGTGGDSNFGYLVQSVSASTATLQSPYRGSTTSGVSLTFQAGFLECPEDLSTISSITELTGLEGDPLRFVGTRNFEAIKRNRSIVSTVDRIYTVRRDPLNLTDRYYVSVFPYIGSASTVQGEYYADHPKLVDGTDVPVIPRVHRLAVFYSACWFYSQSKGYPKTGMYREQALDQVQIMAKEYEFSDDLDFLDAQTPTMWDTSGLTGSSLRNDNDFF